MAFMSGGGLGIDEEGVLGIDGGGALSIDGGAPLDEPAALGMAMDAPATAGAAGDFPAVAGPAKVFLEAAKSPSMVFLSGGGLGIDEEETLGIDGGGALSIDGGAPLDEPVARGIAMNVHAAAGAGCDGPAVAGPAKVSLGAAS